MKIDSGSFSLWEKVRMRVFSMIPSPRPSPGGERELV